MGFLTVRRVIQPAYEIVENSPVLGAWQHNHNFIKDLPAMAEYASTFFGQDSHGLLRKGMPQGLVNIGPIKSLGEAPQN
jgi:hypothetical protein